MTIIKPISACTFFLALATPVFCVDYVVQIACYYFPESGAETYEYLKNPDSTPVTSTADFDTTKRVYRLASGESEKFEDSCRNQLKPEKKALSKIMAIAHQTSKITGDWLGIHYNILDVNHEARQKVYKEVLKVYDTLEHDITFENDITANDQSDSETKAFLDHLKTIISEDTPRDSMISHAILVDFPREDVTVLDNDKPIYVQSKAIAKNLLEGTTKRYSGRDEVNYSREPFRLIEEAVLRKFPDMDKLTLRKNIGKALHTRMQGYEMPSLLRLINHFLHHNTNSENVINTNQDGRGTHTFNVVGDKLHITSIMNFKVELTTPFTMRIGVVVSERAVIMDLAKGTFSPEIITLTKFDYL